MKNKAAREGERLVEKGYFFGGGGVGLDGGLFPLPGPDGLPVLLGQFGFGFDAMFSPPLFHFNHFCNAWSSD